MKTISKIYQIRCIYEIEYDFCFMGEILEHKKERIFGFDTDTITPINKVLKQNEHLAGTVQNISVRKVN
jgi:hypothetical protein